MKINCSNLTSVNGEILNLTFYSCDCDLKKIKAKKNWLDLALICYNKVMRK